MSEIFSFLAWLNFAPSPLQAGSKMPTWGWGQGSDRQSNLAQEEVYPYVDPREAKHKIINNSPAVCKFYRTVVQLFIIFYTPCSLYKYSAKTGLPKMQYRFLGRSGLQVSANSLGGWLTYGGLLLAVTMDGNDEILPLAWAIVPTKSIDDWLFFLKHIIASFPAVNDPSMVVIGNRGKRLVSAVTNYLPLAAHCHCA